MRKYILVLLILLLAAPIAVQAENHSEKSDKYRGFVELGTSFNIGFYNPRGTGAISTTHGYQINTHLFVGAGLGFTALCRFPIQYFRSEIYSILRAKSRLCIRQKKLR